MNIRESELPGIGCKFEIITKNDEKVVIVIHDDGRREIYLFDTDHDEVISNIAFNDTEARQMAAILGGMTYKPKALETIEMAFAGLVIEWFKVEPNAPAEGQTIGDLNIRNNFNVTVISMLKNNMKEMLNAGPEAVINKGDTLVISGEREQVKKVITELLSNRGD